MLKRLPHLSLLLHLFLLSGSHGVYRLAGLRLRGATIALTCRCR